MKKQEVKLEYNSEEVFFFEHGFKTAYEHANDFVKRNKGKFKMKLFLLNVSSYGEKWLLREVHEQ